MLEKNTPGYQPLEDLNTQQLKAVNTTEGPLLVLAGAGTGKTKVLVSRIANIITKGTFPSQILAVTFTNKAAREMANRIETLVGHQSQGLWLGTFHSIAAKILRRHAELIGLKNTFTIIDTDDQIRLIKQIIADNNIDEKRWQPKILASIINRWKDKGLTPEKLTSHEAQDFANGRAQDLYQQYQNRLKALNACDFGDLLLHNMTLFLNNKDVLDSYHRQFKYILVDEYQDTNIIQYLWLRLLAQGHNNICCVGDDDQSIYGWRGAEVGNILKFEKDYDNAVVIRLEQNYRSTSHILDAASHLISQNASRLGKTLWTQEEGGETIKLLGLWDEQEEARYIAEEIESLQHSKEHNLKEIAVLVRAGFQTRAFEEAFINNSIPYKVIGGLRFYERMEIRDVIAYLRLASEYNDDLALERIINTPKRGIGASTFKNIREASQVQNTSLSQAIRNMLAEGAFKPKMKEALKKFTNQLDKWHSLIGNMTVAELTKLILDESGYIQMWKTEKTVEAQGRIENIKELIHALEEFDTLHEFLEHVSLVTDQDQLNNDEMVNIMTLHAAKGLEFNTVFLPGWEEGLFPHQKSIDEKGKAGLEEERRLAYVGITRAKQRAYILFAANRRVYGQWQNSIPSRFVDELPEDNIEHIPLNNGFNFRTNHTPTIPSRQVNESQIAPTLKRTLRQSEAGFEIGERVFHVKFGHGQILNIDGDQLDIFFEKAGKKKVLDAYVEKDS